MQMLSVFHRKTRWVGARVSPHTMGLWIAISVAFVLVLGASAEAATFTVDAANPNATDVGTGAGSNSTPYRTIQAAVDARGVAGNTILVKPAIYRETVTIAASGRSGKPVVLQANAGVVISGADAIAAADWTPVAGNVYLTSRVLWKPQQVFANGARLDSSVVAPASMPANTFQYVTGSGLYVNVGGGNPALKGCEVGRRAMGIDVHGSFWRIDGFTVTRAEERDIYVRPGATSTTVQNCTATFASRHGIEVDGASGIVLFKNVANDNYDHGISIRGSAGTKVQNNESFRNARPSFRAANGINVHSSPSSIVENNNCHDNQDTGIQFYSGSNNCVSRNNVSWNNGDHGFDHLQSTGVMHLHDVAYGNYKDGFSIEGSSSGCSLYNCISVNNGLTTNEYDLWVDAASSVGFVSDYNIFWNATSQNVVKIGATPYATLTSYRAATGQDGNSRQANPLFILPSAGNFRLMMGSPAIDAARSGIPNWPSTDAAGASRWDYGSTPNTGAGNPAYADRGAYEFRTNGRAPVAKLRLTPTHGESPLNVTADAAQSTDADGPIASYTFDFGDGTIVGPQASPLATHVFAAGTWTTRVTVSDPIGLTATATAIDTVALGDVAPVVAAPAAITAMAGQVAIVTVTASDSDSPSIASLTANLSGLPAGHNAVFTSNAGHTAGTLTWTPAASDVRPAPYNVSFTAANAKSGTASTAITVQQPNNAPVAVLSVSPQSGSPMLNVTADASGSFDSDGSVASYRFDFGDGTIVGPQASPTATHSYDLGNWNVRVTVVDDRGASTTSAPVMVQVLGLGPNLVANPSFETNLSGWVEYGADTLYRVAGGQSGSFALEMRAAASDTALFGVNDSPNWVTNAGPAGTRYRFTAWVRSAAHRGRAKLRLREFSGATQNGPTQLTSGIVLSPTWQPLTLEYTTLATGSSLDFDVVDARAVPAEIFQVDNITIQKTSLSLPVITMPASAAGAEGSAISFTLSVSDPDGDPITGLTSDLTGLPAGHNATFVTNASRTQGTFTWTPSYADARANPYPVTFLATSGISGAATGSVLIQVTNVDRAPVVTAPEAVTVVEGEVLTLGITASDPDSDAIATLSANLSALPAGNNAVFTTNPSKTAGTLTWTPVHADSGIYTLPFTASNALSDSSSTTVTVRHVDRAPGVTAPATASATEGEALTLPITASDPDGEAIATLVANLSGLPAGNNAVFSANPSKTGGTLTWTPTHADSGTYTVAFTAANAMAGSASCSIHVDNVDRAPAVTAQASADAIEGQSLNLAITASDSDGDAIAVLSADLTGLPAGSNAVFTSNPSHTAGTLTWTPAASDVRPAPYTVTFTASNAGTGSASTAITVQRPNAVPVAVLTVTPPSGGAPLAVTADASASFDSDGSLVGYTFDFGDGTIVGPQASPVATHSYGIGNWNARVTVVDDRGTGVTSSPVMVQVLGLGPNLVTNPSFETSVTGWSIYGADTLLRVAGGQSGSFALEMRSAASNLALFGCNDSPNFVPNAGPAGTRYRFTAWVRSAAHTGKAKLRLREFNGSVQQGATVLTPGLTLSPVWQPITLDYITLASGSTLDFNIVELPVVGGEIFQVDNISIQKASLALPVVTVPASVAGVENSAIAFTVTASDPNGDPITGFTADFSGLPAGHGATFVTNPSRTQGTFSWTPSYANGRIAPYSVSFIATSGTGASGSSSVAMVVANVDRAPAVVTPATVDVDETGVMTLHVTAADADGDAIAALSVDLSTLPAGHNAEFASNASHTGGTLTWTPTYADSGTYSVQFTAANALSGSASSVVRVANLDQLPVVMSPASANVVEGGLLSLAVTATDPDGDPITDLSANLAGLPVGNDAAFTSSADHSAGTLTWTPTHADSGAYALVFTATNALSASASSSVRVENVDRAPIVSAPVSTSAIETELMTLTVTASDPDGDSITALDADLSGLPAGSDAAFTPSGDHRAGTVTWTPTTADAPGTYVLTFSAQNALSGSASTSVVVSRFDAAPVVSAPASIAATEGATLEIEVAASDVDGGPITDLSADLSGLPGGNDAVFTPNADHTAGTLVWTPTHADSGTHVVSFTAANARNGSATTAIHVMNVDRALTLTAPATASIDENDHLSLEVTAFDPDGEAITLSADLSSLPAGNDAIFTPNASHTGGALSWRPTHADSGSYVVVFDAASSTSASATCSIHVGNVDRAPAIAVASAVTVDENTLLRVEVTASDPDGDPIAALDANLSSLPVANNAVFTTNADHTGGTLTWTPTVADAPASYPVVFSAANALTGNGTTTITVRRVDLLPVVTVSATAAATEGQPFTLEVTASDPDGPIASLTADLSGLPAGSNAAFTPNADHTGGTFTWTPTFADARELPYQVTFTAANTLSASGAVAITVANVDRAPVVTVVPVAGGNENQGIDLAVTASDPDGDAILSLVADLSLLPAAHNATFVPNATNTGGSFGWTPAIGMGRSAPYRVTFTATNAGWDSAGTSINVNALPVAVLAVTPVSGTAPLTVAANAGGSSDRDGSVVSYTFNFGDGITVGPQASASASHTYGAGTFTASVTVTDDQGATSTAYQTVTAHSNLCGNAGFETALTGWGQSGSSLITRVSGGHSGLFCLNVQGQAGQSTTFGAQDTPNWITSTPAAGTRYRFTAWVRSDVSHGNAKIKVREYLGGLLQGSAGISAAVSLTPSWQQIVYEFTCTKAGSTLDLEIGDSPVGPGESFQVDDVTISIVPAAALELGMESRAELPAPVGSALAFSAAAVPNPIRRDGELHFSTTQPGMVRVEIFDAGGRLVQKPVDKFVGAGRHTVPLRTRGGSAVMPAGCYFYRLNAAEGIRQGRFIILD